jgi:4-hydroxybenzoate polyprenyltransferase
MVFARSAAMAFNRFIDRKIDAKNPRTATREIPAGIIAEKKALYFVIINGVLFIATTFFINPICFYLSPIALFTILFYSYTKRFTSLCHFVLGIGLSLAPIGAYLAVTGVFALMPILFSFTVFTWVAGFDIMYALQDEAFDKSEQLYSIPSQLGVHNALKLSVIVHFITACLIIGIGLYSNFHPIYWIGASIFNILLVYQHLIVKPNDLSRINLAFGTTNGVASIVFAFFTILSIYLTT